MKNAVIIAIVMTLAMMGWNGQSKAEEFTKVDTGKVVAALKDPNWVVVDTRQNDAFNGWNYVLIGSTPLAHVPQLLNLARVPGINYIFSGYIVSSSQC